MRFLTCFGSALVVGAFSIAAVVVAEPAPRVAPLAEVASLPPEVAPLDPALEDDMADLVESAIRFRGLELLRSLAVGTQNEVSARQTIAALLAEELPPAEAEVVERALVALGLWPPGRDLMTVLVEVLSSEVAGYYDPRRDYLAVVDSGRVLEDLDAGGPELAARMSDAVWVHEIGHALQDQHFDLETIGGDEELLSDLAMARDALIEGDATLLMFSFLLGVDIARVPSLEGMLGSLLDDVDQAAAMFGDGDAGALRAAPAYLRQSLIFPYIGGLAFCLEVRRYGGQKLLDHAFRRDRPRSTEQVLHPEKWLGPRDEPVEVQLGDLGDLLGGRQRLLEGSLGEMTIRVLLAEGLLRGGETGGSGAPGPTGVAASEARRRARDAAAGWGGDSVALYGHRAGDAAESPADGAGDVLVWVTEWDSEADARELDAAAAAAMSPRWLRRRSGSRVVFVHGLGAAAAEPALDRLEVVPAARRHASSIDLAALGIVGDDIPRPLGAGALAKLLADPSLEALIGAGTEPAGAETDGGVALDAEREAEAAGGLIADSDDPLALAMQLAAEMTAGGGLDPNTLLDGVDLDELLESPAMVEMASRLLAQTSNPEIVVSSGTVRIDALGFRLSLPEAARWTGLGSLDAPTVSEAGEMAPAFEAYDDATGAFVTITAVELPIPVALETVVLGLRAVALLDAPEELRSGFLEARGRRSWERELVGHQQGVRLRLVQRVYLLDGSLVILQAGGGAAAWDAVGPLVRATMDGIRIAKP